MRAFVVTSPLGHSTEGRATPKSRRDWLAALDPAFVLRVSIEQRPGVLTTEPEPLSGNRHQVLDRVVLNDVAEALRCPLCLG